MLSIGARIGPYEVTGTLGAGGMGEVYRAHDERLGRDVALKVLPEAYAADPERLGRFQREAQVLAALTHSNIGSIYGLEEQDGVRALVLELVEGDTLADRLARGSLPVDEALPIARQIAEALEAAHEQGVIHRDLKPANVKVGPDGVVKVLDFGLAKLASPADAGAHPVNTMSPTLSVHATMAGVILGTAAYMSPEQARGRPVDKRADIWAFGCVLYEMLAGKRAFDGEDITDTIVAIVSKEADWSALPAATPTAVRTLLHRCVEKDPKRRLRDIGEARLAIEGTLLTAHKGPSEAGRFVPADGARSGVATGFRRPVWLRVVGLAVAFGATALLTGAAVWFATRPAPPRVSRLVIAPDADAALRVHGAARDIAISPDATTVVYAGGAGAGGAQLLVRTLDQLEVTSVGRFTLPRDPFFSADGQWIGFFDQPNALKKVAISGGPAVTIVAANGLPRGATWGPDDTVIFATGNPEAGLQRVASSGGEITVLTKPNREAGEANHVWPSFLPGGRAVLFTITPLGGEPAIDSAQIAVLDLETGAHKILVRGGSHAQYVSSGHLVYGVAGTLRAVPFDVTRLEVVGSPVPVVPELMMTGNGATNFGVANDGTLLYVPGGVVSGGGASAPKTLVWVDRQGREEPLPAPPRAYTYPRISPDGTRVALDIRDQMQDIWVWDFARATLTRVTFNPGADQYPVWTPDSRRLLFGTGVFGAATLAWQSADGTGTVERLADAANTQIQVPFAISPDGARVVVRVGQPAPRTAGLDLAAILLGRERRVEPLIQTPYRELNADVSPDGRWLAYESDESGQREVYVRPFPDVSGGRWQVSSGGGTRPVFTRNGQELVYLMTAGGVGGAVTLMSLRVQPAPTWSAGNPTKLFTGGYFYNDGAGAAGEGRTYDVSPDGRCFLMVKEVGTKQPTAAPNLVVIQSWGEELKRLAPRN